jgi:transposase
MGYSACAPFRTKAFVEVLRYELMVEPGLCVKQPQGSGRKHSMKHYVGLDVSVKETAICIVDETGRICQETKVVSHPEDLSKALTETGLRIERIGFEAGPLSQWLFEGMALAGLRVICVETGHTTAFLRAQINKSDRNDARGIARMMRVNLHRPLHEKTLASQKRRALLRARKLLQEKVISIEIDIRGLLRNFALKVGIVGAAIFGRGSRSSPKVRLTWRSSSTSCLPPDGSYATASLVLMI